MNCTFSNMLQELQKDEIKKQIEEAERVQKKEQHKQDLLKGNPFKFATRNRVRNYTTKTHHGDDEGGYNNGNDAAFRRNTTHGRGEDFNGNGVRRSGNSR